jgi:hypothetical protein
MKARTPLLLLLAAAPLLVSACGKLMGPPPRPRSDGYAALVTVTAGDAELAKFRLAVRGEALRRSATDAKDSPYFIRETPAGPVWEVDPAAKSYRPGTPEALLAHLDAFPLGPDFNDAAEANRRGIKDYHRESDAVFAGNACVIWRFDDLPDALNSPTTVYWTTPALDGIVVRKVRTVPTADGKEEKTFVELTHVRVGVEPEEFRVPEGFRKEAAPAP